MDKEILRIGAVVKKVRLSKASIYLYISRDEFPHQYLIGKRAVGWKTCEINDWIDSLESPTRASGTQKKVGGENGNR